VPVSAHTQVTDLAPIDHACLTFGEQEELLDLTAAFVRDGLARFTPLGVDLLPHVSLVGVHD
jgi:hypothetical protein